MAQAAGGGYTWHRLAVGTKVSFALSFDATAATGVATFETFTVVGDALVLAVRQSGADSSSLYRVSATGVVTPQTAFDFPSNPVKQALPRSQHLEYGVDGHLYMVLRQGVLVSKDFS